MIRKIIHLSIVAVLVLSIAVCFSGCFEEPEPAISVEPAEEASVSSDNGFTEATIAKVVDGDTVKVMLGGQKITIRIIGINTPESVAEDESRNTEEGRKASEYVKELLPVGTKVYIEYDLDDEDQYGRTLAYLWLKGDADPEDYDDFCRYNVGALIMQNTYCESVYYKPNKKYLDWLRRLESEYQPQ